MKVVYWASDSDKVQEIESDMKPMDEFWTKSSIGIVFMANIWDISARPELERIVNELKELEKQKSDKFAELYKLPRVKR